jgi:hypothetical protein
MKLFKLKLTTLKSKLYAIVFASFVVRVVAFFVLPNKESYLGPDEGNYGALTEWIAQGKPADEYPYTTLYIISRSHIVPATLLNRLGLNGLDSVRIIASLYGLLSLTLIAFVLLRIVESRQEAANFVFKNQKTALILFSIFGFLPSHLIWSILGLREAVMEFWVLIVFSLVFYVFEVKKSPSKLAFLGVLVVIPLVFSSRPQVGWVIGVTLLIYFLFKVRVKAAQILIPLTVIGIVSGYVVTTAFSVETTEVFVAHKEIVGSSPSVSSTSKSSPSSEVKSKPSKSGEATSSPTATTSAEFEASRLCESEGQEVSLGESKYLCSKEVEKKSIVGLKNPGVALVDQADGIPVKREGNKIGAESAIKTLSCPITGESRLDKYSCIAYKAPYTTYTFLFRPLLGSDVTSNSSLFAAVENVFWLGALLFVAVMFIRNRRLAFFGALAPSLLFFSIYSVAAGAYEGNMGTAFRHKSLILWVVLLLLASTIVATQQRKAEHQGISGSSKE